LQKIKSLSIPKTSRIIVISDIHGELELFKKLLEKVLVIKFLDLFYIEKIRL
jgi:hypothetical protein